MTEKIPHQDIVKSNALIEAVYNPGNVYQMRLLLAALLKVTAKNPIDHRTRYVVAASEMAELTGSKAKNNYPELKKAAKDLMEMTVVIEHEPNGDKRGPTTTFINLVSSCRYYSQEGYVELRFTEEITPYISDLKTRFTQYEAKNVMPMRSSYGIRLYELCLAHLGETRTFTIEEFRKVLGLEKKYTITAELKRRVINPALRDINKYSDLHVEFSQRKRGHRVAYFDFAITKPEPKTPKIKPLDHDTWITRFNMTKPYSPQGSGETYEQARQRTYGEYMLYRKNPEKWISARAAIEHDSIT